MKRYVTYVSFIVLLALSLLAFRKNEATEIISYAVNSEKQHVKLYWKDKKGQILGSLLKLKQHVEANHESLLFGTNAGMYMENRTPLGLFIHEGKIVHAINTGKGSGNFHLMPNGIFYISSSKKAGIVTTENFKTVKDAYYATQSGPMLLINGAVHPSFTQGSANLNIRNGVGILPDGSILFAMSKHLINFYDFALFFKKKGCKNALYLDGFVSRTYFPEGNWTQTDGDFGVMIGVSEPEKRNN